MKHRRAGRRKPANARAWRLVRPLLRGDGMRLPDESRVPAGRLDPHEAGAAVAWQKLRRKFERNRALGPVALFEKSVRFARSTAASRYYLRAATSVGVGVRLVGPPPVIQRPAGTIRLGDDVSLVARVTAIFFAVLPGATLEIGDEAWLNDGVWFGCTERITIGRRALIGPGVRVFDNAYHDLYDRRRTPPGRPVTIGDDVWIAAGVTILPGVTVGRGAVLGAGALVQEDVAPFTVVAGNPARLVRTLDPARFVGPSLRGVG